MRKKPNKRRPSLSRKTPTHAPLFKTVIRRILKWFEEDLPITEFHGPGKFDTEVAGTRDHQAALESLCGGRSAKAQKLMFAALLTPAPRDHTMRVEIEGKMAGHLKPADVKLLQKQLAAAEMGPCALQVSALVQGGRTKKNGETEDFTVSLCLPKPEKKTSEPKCEKAISDEGEDS